MAHHSKSHFVNSSSGLDPHLPVRPPRRRHPLSDATNWVNNQSLSPREPWSINEPSSDDQSSDPPSIPHHSSLHPGGVLQVPNIPSSSPLSKIEDKRVSAVSSEEARASNRLSQISQTSTNASGTNGKGRRKTHVGPWRLGRTIGKGASGRVRKARHAVTGQDAAVKIVSKKSAEVLRSQSLAFIDAKVDNGRRTIPIGIEREVVIMKMIEHPNIIRLFDIWENRGELYLVLEYVEGGELFNHISSKGGLPEYEAVRIFRQIIAALAYCHQFHICHRDLKPENILLDRNRNIKIVDFGMAALQPANKWLKTPCGSPHYASPEVIRAEPYRGDKADIWSCGVILFAMLAGFLPFDAHTEDWRDVIQAVLECDYKVPEWLSPEAQDLICRILHPDPHRRMSIKRMWDHPLLKKYAHLDSPSENGECLIGPPAALTIQDCGPRIRQRADIDAELLRNLHNLWHGATKDELVHRLLSDEPNHEKIVYSKLLRYREEQLEHYEGPPLEASTSDYHHVTRSNKPDYHPSAQASLRSMQGRRQQSQYSLADTHLQSLIRRPSQAPQRHASVAETEKTAESYDPYRSSRNPVTKSHVGNARVTLLREVSQSSRRRPSATSVGKSSLKASTLHVQQEMQEMYSIPSSPPTKYSSGAFPIQRRLASQHRMSRGNSKVTICSVGTGKSGSSQIVASKLPSYKRDVSFNHRRRRSVSSDQPHLRSREHQLPSKTLQERYVRDKVQKQSIVISSPPSLSLRGTPMPDVQPAVRSKKEGGKTLDAAAASAPKSRGDTNWNDDVRKISTELNKLCDTAFNRVSVSSSAPTAITPGSYNRDFQGRNVSSATSFSIFEDPVLENDGCHVKTGMKDASTQAYHGRRPPSPPTMDPLAQDRLGSYTQRELAKTRDLLKKRNRASYMEPGYLDDVIAHLDRLMQPSNVRLVDEERRAVTDPSSTGLSRKDTFEQIIENGDIGFRSASEPGKESGKRRRHRQREQTIRVVEDAFKPLSPIQPLTIRKKSGASSMDPSSPTPTKLPFSIDNAQVRRSDKPNAHPLDPTLLGEALDPLKQVENFDPAVRDAGKGSAVEYKKRSWFHSQPQPKASKDTAMVPPSFDRDHHQALDQTDKRASATSDESRVSETKKKSKGGGFLRKIFTGKRDAPIKSTGGGDYHLNMNDRASFDTDDSSLSAPRSLTRPSRELLHLDSFPTAKNAYPSKGIKGSTASHLKQKSIRNDDDIFGKGDDVRGKKDKEGKRKTTKKSNGNNRERSPMPMWPPPPPPLARTNVNVNVNSNDIDDGDDDNPSMSQPITKHRRRQQRQNRQEQGQQRQRQHLNFERASNWLARFLGIQPAVHVLCFCVGKTQARREIVAVLKSWKRFGMRDVAVEKGRVWARVDKENSLHIPPLTLAADVHNLLHRGRLATDVCIARLTQERGAKSSFERVVRALEGVLSARGVLVKDEGVWGEMRRGAGF